MTTTVKAKFRPSTVKDRPGTIVLSGNSPPYCQTDHYQLQSVPTRMGRKVFRTDSGRQ